MTSYSFAYAVTAKSSIKVLGELLRVSEAPLDHLAETRDGFVASISIPGVSASGAIYAYDRPTNSMSILTVDDRDSDFTPEEIAEMFPAVVKHLNAPSIMPRVGRPEPSNKQPEKNQSQRHQQNRNNNRPRRRPATMPGSPRSERVQVAA